MGKIQEKDFTRGVKWVMDIFLSRSSILHWNKFTALEPPHGATILCRYTKNYAFDYSLMEYGDNEFKRSVLLSVDAEWSLVDNMETLNYWYMGTSPNAAPETVKLTLNQNMRI
jgi:hypothetical protein